MLYSLGLSSSRTLECWSWSWSRGSKSVSISLTVSSSILFSCSPISKGVSAQLTAARIHCIGGHPVCGVHSRGKLNPVKSVYSWGRPSHAAMCVPGNSYGYCYTCTTRRFCPEHTSITSLVDVTLLEFELSRQFCVTAELLGVRFSFVNVSWIFATSHLFEC